jgi:hypothetical protein
MAFGRGIDLYNVCMQKLIVFTRISTVMAAKVAEHVAIFRKSIKELTVISQIELAILALDDILFLHW